MPELDVAGVDDELLAGLGVLDHDHPRVGELVLPGVDEPDRDDLVALAQLQQGSLPSGRGDEVRDEDDERAPTDRSERRLEQPRQVGDRPVRFGRRPQEVPRERENLVPAAARRQRLLDLVVEQDCPYPVAAPREEPREGRRELAQHELLRPIDRPEAHRGRPVE